MSDTDDEFDDEGEKRSEETPWLRDMVDDDLQVLFVDDEQQLQRGVRRLLHASRDDADVERRLIQLLDTSIEEGNDDSFASCMTAVILGENRSSRAIGTLGRCLASDEDEDLQGASAVALLRIGAPAIDGILEALEGDEHPRLDRPAYELLGQVGVLEDESLRQRVMDFLESRVDLERTKPRSESAIEELFRASALLGDRRQIEVMKKVIAEDFGGRHPGIQDSCEMLEENEAGAPFVPTQPPWEARYGWLFEDDRGEARVSRSRSGEISLAFGDEDNEADADADEESELADDSE